MGNINGTKVDKAIRRAADTTIPKRFWIVSSAGKSKTSEIDDLITDISWGDFIHMLQGGKNPDEIIMITTKFGLADKAAQAEAKRAGITESTMMDEATDKKNVITKGKYVLLVNDPIHHQITKGKEIDIPKNLVSDEVAMGVHIFFVKIDGKRLGITKDMIKPVK